MSDEIDEDDISIRFGCQRVLDVIMEQIEGGRLRISERSSSGWQAWWTTRVPRRDWSGDMLRLCQHEAEFTVRQ